MTGLASAYINLLDRNPAVGPATVTAVEVDLSNGTKFVPAAEAESVAAAEGFTGSVADELVATYEAAQLQALKTGLLAAAGVAALTLLVTGGLPSERLRELAEAQTDSAGARTVAGQPSLEKPG